MKYYNENIERYEVFHNGKLFGKFIYLEQAKEQIGKYFIHLKNIETYFRNKRLI